MGACLFLLHISNEKFKEILGALSGKTSVVQTQLQLAMCRDIHNRKQSDILRNRSKAEGRPKADACTGADQIAHSAGGVGLKQYVWAESAVQT